MIAVVAALILENGKALATKRTSTQLRPGLWEFPGGKVEPGETEREALARECREELDVGVHVGPLVSTAMVTAEERFHILLYRCHITDGRPRAAERQAGIDWIAPRDLIQYYPLTPATYAFWPDVREVVARIRS